MRIARKLILGFLIESVVVVLLIWAVGYLAVSASEKAIRRSIEDGSASISFELLSKMERTMHYRIEVFEAYTRDLILQNTLKESNRFFEALSDPQANMEKVEKEWRSVPAGTLTPFMKELMDSELSRELREKMDYYNKRHKRTMFGEVFVTNRFGTNVAMTSRTTDFIQSDESWWREAKARPGGKAVVGEVDYDESAGLYSLDASIRIDDDEGNFIGVMKVVMNVEELTGMLRDSISRSTPIMQKASLVTLLDSRDRVLFSTGEHEFLQHIPGLHPEHVRHVREGVQIFVNERGGVITVHAHSGGEYGMDWLLVTDHEEAVLFAPVKKVRQAIILVSLVVSALVVVTGLMITGTVTRPVLRLRDAALRVRSGDLDALVDVGTGDEVGDLAESFRDMRERLLSTMVSKDFMTSVIEHMTGALFVVSPEGKMILSNRAAAGLIELKDEDISNRDAPEVLPPEMTELIQEVLSRGEIRSVERTVASQDGKKVPLLFSGILLRTDEGRPVATILAAEDISELRRAEKRIRVFSDAVAGAFDSIVISNITGEILYANESAVKSFGYTREEMRRLNVKAFTRDWDADRISKERANAPGGWSGEVVAARKNGEEFPAVLSISLVKDPIAGTIAMMGVFRDISERKASEEKMVRMAYYDDLTGLPNKRLFFDRLSNLLPFVRRQSLRAAVLLIDLDQFKVVNETLGHAAGDELLKSVAERLKTVHREYDTVARLGGDEFCILVHDLDRVESIGYIIEKVFASFKVPFPLKDQDIYVTPSIGVSVYPDDGVDADTLIKNADIALYRAKDDGRNNYKLYTSVMNTRTLERLRLTNELYRAIEKKEFVLHYQPQIECRSGEITGVEALVRWNRAGSIVPPSEFIPLLEETGLIVALGEWILRAACKEIKTWQTMGLKVTSVAVNVSTRQFKHPKFLETVGVILKETGVEPGSVELELTESIVMEKGEQTSEWMRKLKEMGLKITIDDFGTGYSCLEYLKRMPIDMLKIDSTFVRDITTDKDDAAIAIAIIRVAHTLGLEVVAEGVETVEQFKFLKNLLCDKVQGYLFSRPLPANECLGLLKRGKFDI